MRYLWISIGWLSVLCAVIGIALPLLPTVPFLLLAAFCFSKSSPRFHTWLTQHPTLGPPIQAWARDGAISQKAKSLATLTIAASLGLTLYLGVPIWVIVLQTLVLTAVLVFIWSRPNPST